MDNLFAKKVVSYQRQWHRIYKIINYPLPHYQLYLPHDFFFFFIRKRC